LHQITWKRLDNGDWHIKVAGVIRSGFARQEHGGWTVGVPSRDRIRWTTVARLAQAKSILISWWLTHEEFLATAESMAYEAELVRLALLGKELGVPQPEVAVDDPRVGVERRVSFAREWIRTGLDRVIKQAGRNAQIDDDHYDFGFHVALATRATDIPDGEGEMDRAVIDQAQKAKALL
jgi:hypothetical protein